MKKFIIYSAGLTGIVFFPKFIDCFQLPKLIFIFIFTLLVYIYLFIYEKKFKNFKNDIFFLPIFAFVFWRIVSLKNCTNIYLGIYNILILIFFITLYYGLINFFENEEEIKIFLKSFAFFSIIISIYGILQVFGIDFINWEIKYTALSTLGRRNFAGEYLVMVIPYVYCLINIYKKERIFYTFVLILLISHLILTFTRASYIALFFSTLLFIFLLKQKKPKFSKKILTLIFFIFLINKGICEIKTFEKGTLKARILIWKDAIRIIKENPIFGIGPGNFEIVYPVYSKNKENPIMPKNESLRDVHNDIIEFGVESGILGILTFLFLILYPFYIFFKNKKFNIISISIISSLFALYINCLASFPFKKYSTLFLFWCNLSFLSVIYKKSDKEKKFCKPILIYFLIFTFASFLFISRGILANYFIKKAKDGIKVIENTEKGVKANPFSFEFNYFAGNIEYFYGKNYDKAMYYFERTKSLFPNYDRLYNNLGIIYFNMGDFKNAEENYKKAIYLNPNRPETYNNIGSLYIETGKYNDAIPYLLKCIEISPSFYIAYFNLGMAYYLKGDYKKAKEYFKKTLEIKPDFKPAKDIIYKNEKNINN